MRILISDYHPGTALMLASTFSKIYDDVDVHVMDRIDKTNYKSIFKLWQEEDLLISKNPDILNEAIKRIEFVEDIALSNQDRSVIYDKKYFDNYLYDVVVTSFPPAYAATLEAANIAPKVHLILGHRLDFCSKDWTCTSDSRKKIFDYAKNSNWVISSMNIYDKKYFEYYTGREVEYLPFVATHALKFFNPEESNEIFVGPFHAKNKWRTDYLGHEEKKYCGYGTISEIVKKINKESDFDFFCKEKDFIGTERIAAGVAVVNFPYSAYSVSEYEYSALGLPLIVPNNSLVIKDDIMDDRAIHPLFGSEEDILNSEKKYIKSNIPSPQHKDSESQEYWLDQRDLKEKTFYEFSSLEDLVQFLNKTDIFNLKTNLHQKEKDKLDVLLKKIKRIVG